eukprot:6070314-Alexandrium_andersonii.AAC.1
MPASCKGARRMTILRCSVSSGRAGAGPSEGPLVLCGARCAGCPPRPARTLGCLRASGQEKPHCGTPGCSIEAQATARSNAAPLQRIACLSLIHI